MCAHRKAETLHSSVLSARPDALWGSCNASPMGRELVSGKLLGKLPSPSLGELLILES